MPGQPGLSFSPLETTQNGSGGGGSQGSPLQDAIKILSFRLPTVVGASGISPLAGNPGESVANDWLMRLFQGLMPAGAPGMAAPGLAPEMASAPMPSAPVSPFGASMGAFQAPTWQGAPPPGPLPPSIPDPVIHPSEGAAPPIMPPPLGSPRISGGPYGRSF